MDQSTSWVSSRRKGQVEEIFFFIPTVVMKYPTLKIYTIAYHVGPVLSPSESDLQLTDFSNRGSGGPGGGKGEGP